MAAMLPLLAAGAAAVYFLTRKGEPSGASGSTTTDGKVIIDFPRLDGTTTKLAVHPQLASGMLVAAARGNPAEMRALADAYEKGGYTEEAAVLRDSAKIAELYASTHGTFTTTSTVVSPKPEAPPALSQPPAELVKLLTDAVASGNPAQIRAAAAALRAAGFTSQADMAVTAASVLEAAQATPKPAPLPAVVTPPALPQYVPPSIPTLAPTPVPTPVAVSVPVPTVAPTVVTVPTTALPAPQPAPALTVRRKLADALVRHLTVSPPAKGKEDKGIVAAYQAAAGLKDDGLYGPGTAKSLAESESGKYVPPSPRRWPAGTYATAAKQYEQWLSTQAALDPARADEWSMAKATSRKYYP